MLSCNKFIHQSLELHLFFARIMKEHSSFLEIGFTPKNSNHIAIANAFRIEFDKLTREAIKAMDKCMPISKVTNESLKATAAISKFKAQGTQGLVECKIKSIIIPLLGDHTLREANHYLRLLKIFKKVSDTDCEMDEE